MCYPPEFPVVCITAVRIICYRTEPVFEYWKVNETLRQRIRKFSPKGHKFSNTITVKPNTQCDVLNHCTEIRSQVQKKQIFQLYFFSKTDFLHEILFLVLHQFRVEFCNKRQSSFWIIRTDIPATSCSEVSRVPSWRCEYGEQLRAVRTRPVPDTNWLTGVPLERGSCSVAAFPCNSQTDFSFFHCQDSVSAESDVEVESQSPCTYESLRFPSYYMAGSRTFSIAAR